MSTLDPGWDYQQAWDLLHDAMDLIVEVNKEMEVQEETSNEVNERVFPKIVEASMKTGKASQIVSAMTKEEKNNGSENNSL